MGEGHGQLVPVGRRCALVQSTEGADNSEIAMMEEEYMEISITSTITVQVHAISGPMISTEMTMSTMSYD